MDLCDEDKEVTDTSDWIDAIDRGGLVRISENTFEFFQTMELVLRCVYNTETVQEVTSATRENLCRLIITNDDVLFYRCMVTVEVDQEEANRVDCESMDNSSRLCFCKVMDGDVQTSKKEFNTEIQSTSM